MDGFGRVTFVLPILRGQGPVPLPAPGDGTVSSGSVSSGPAIANRAPEQTQSQSLVSVLSVRGRQLVTVGSVGGLGRGETIRAVRFIGPVGYVVTFRQTDPLYTLDLSRPDRPRVVGELKLLGYSAYLHPVGDGLLLGLGEAADATGATSGLQMSLFDVSDPATPRRLAQVQVTGAYSDAEGDHHAFTFADGLALAPYTRYSLPVPVTSQPPPVPAPGSAPTTSDSAVPTLVPGSAGSGATGPDQVDAVPVSTFDTGVLAVRVQGDRLSPPVSLRPMARGPIAINPTGQGPDDIVQATPLRTVVVDGFIYTVTPVGIAVHDAATLQRVGFTPF